MASARPGGARRQDRPHRARRGRPAARARHRGHERERDAEIGAGLGDAHATDHRDVDVEPREADARLVARAPRRAARAVLGRRPAPSGGDPRGPRTPPGPAPRRAADGCRRRSARRSNRRRRTAGRRGTARSGRARRSGPAPPSRRGRARRSSRSGASAARRSRSAWWRSPPNESTVSTACSSTRGPASSPSLVTWPTSTVAVWRRFVASMSCWAQPLHLRHRARRGAELGVVHRLHRVDDDEVGVERFDQRDDALDVALGREPQPVDQRVDASGAPLHLRGRLLARDVEAPRAGSRDRGRSLQAATSTCRCPARRRRASPTPRRALRPAPGRARRHRSAADSIAEGRPA